MDENYQTILPARCFTCILVSLIALCVLFIPLNGEPVYTLMPIVGNGEIEYFNRNLVFYFIDFTGLSSNIESYINTAMHYGPYAYLIILSANVIFSLLLLLTNAESLRQFFNFCSLIFGFTMMLIMLLQLVLIIGFLGQALETLKNFNKIEFKILILPSVMLFTSSYCSRKQFKWFKS